MHNSGYTTEDGRVEIEGYRIRQDIQGKDRNLKGNQGAVSRTIKNVERYAGIKVEGLRYGRWKLETKLTVPAVITEGGSY
jgi:hypothetical protein